MGYDGHPLVCTQWSTNPQRVIVLYSLSTSKSKHCIHVQEVVHWNSKYRLIALRMGNEFVYALMASEEQIGAKDNN